MPFHLPILQFLNKVSEKLLGYKTEELVGRNLGEIVHYENFTLMEQQLSKGREFEGNMNCKRKNNQMITINCRIIPFCITPKLVEYGLPRSFVNILPIDNQDVRLANDLIYWYFLRKATHFIYVYDTLYLLENSGPLSPINSPLQPMQRMSILSTRKSSDVKSALSEGKLGFALSLYIYYHVISSLSKSNVYYLIFVQGHRRSSLQKLHSLQLEAPITKVITLLSNAITETTNTETAAQIDKVNGKYFFVSFSILFARVWPFFSGNRNIENNGVVCSASSRR